MPDMLVKLYDLPDINEVNNKMKQEGIVVKRAIAPEKHIIVDWVRANFNDEWASACEVAYGNRPISCFIAVKNGSLIGFACYDISRKGFFGPVGVDREARGNGAGSALLLKCLYAMEAVGYGYAIIGGVGPADFYARTVGATIIEGSDPGIYRDMLRSGNNKR